ncbi:MAG: pitrilysin family protein [Thermonemataceae bacterium]|nr:pitrilysin family protein [Thermonemataceae bacterium]
MLDRTQAPQFHKITQVRIFKAEKHQLSNHINLYHIGIGEQAVVRVEWIFRKAGKAYSPRLLESAYTAKMLMEGTKYRNSHQISTDIDQYGAFLHIESLSDTMEISLHCPTKFLAELLPLVAEIIFEPSFPEKELLLLKQKTQQELQVSLKKTQYLAVSEFKKILFGKQHPYGRSNNAEAIENTSMEEIKDFFHKYIYQKEFDICMVGKFEDSIFSVFEQYFGNFTIGQRPETNFASPQKSSQKKFFVEKADSLQNSIIVGGFAPHRKSADYHKYALANTILGGYFGSRLMQNIREEKGYTYGIHTHYQEYENANFMLISTEVKSEYSQATLQEIYKEIRILQNEKVGKEELERVKNYFIGRFAKSLSEGFAQMDLFKIIHYHDLAYDYYENLINNIEAISAEDILAIFQKYYMLEDFYEVVAGSLKS